MELITRALSEYHSEDEDGKTKTVYAYFGLAIFDCQTLELFLETMIFYSELVLNPNITNQIEFDSLKNELDGQKNTLGKTIQVVLKKYQVIDEDKTELMKLLNFRNGLVHSYFKDSVEKFYSEKGKLEMISNFVSISESARTLNLKFEKYTNTFKGRYNLTQEVIESALKELVERELKR